MEATYKTNSAATTKSLTEWFFGKKFVETMTETAKRMNAKTGENTFKFWQDGTGYLTIEIH